MDKEPAVIIGALVAALTVLVNALVTDEVIRGAIVAILVGIGAIATRGIVYSPDSVRKLRP